MIFGWRRGPLRASKIDIKPPKAQANRTGLALVAIARDEALYIGDWLRFHALAGVNDFIIYDNQSSDQTIQIAKSFSSINVRVIPWAMDTSSHSPKMILPRQILAYCHAISNFGSAFRWMGFIDIDEYLVPKNDNTILESLVKLGHFTNISLPWVMFGHGGHDAKPAAPVPFSYTERANHQIGKLLNFKCIVDPCDVIQVSTHKFETKEMGSRTANMNGAVTWNKTRSNSEFTTNDGLQLNHYYLRSKAEMERKIAGPAVSGTEQGRRKAAILEKAAQIEKMATIDTTAVSFLNRHAILTGDDLHKAVL